MRLVKLISYPAGEEYYLNPEVVEGVSAARENEDTATNIFIHGDPEPYVVEGVLTTIVSNLTEGNYN